MKTLWERPLEELAGLSYPCSCGRVHQVGIQSISVGSGCIQKLPAVLQKLGARQVFLLADSFTHQAAGRQVEALLQGAGLPYHTRLFQTQTPLVPNEYALGSALAAMRDRDNLLLAVGSGTLNDTARILSARTGID